MPNTFTRQALAAAVAAVVPTVALASTTLDISEIAPRTLSEHYTGNLQLVGSVQANSEALIDLNGTVDGSLINDANMLIEVHSPYPQGPNGTLYLERGSWVGGDFINNANLIARGISDANVFIGGSTVQGAFINKGLIEYSNGYFGDSGVAIVNSVVRGGFLNEGIIRGAGLEAIGVELDISHLGTIVNTGQIHGEGTGATGLWVGDDVQADSGRIDNLGTISASGPGGTAVRINGQIALHNSGAIMSEDVAVELEQSFTYRFQQNAGLISAPIAIRGNGKQVLRLAGGEIRGDIERLQGIEAHGNSTLDSSRIDARYLDIDFGRLTLASPHSTLTGDLELGSTGQLEFLLSDGTQASRPYLTVLGDALVVKGSSFAVTPKPNDFSLQGPQRYQLVKASEWYQLLPTTNQNAWPLLSQDDLTVTSTSGLLRINSYSLEDGILSAEVEPLQGSSAAELVALEGASSNAQNALEVFSQQLGQLEADDPVFLALANSDAAQASHIAEQLSPEANGASPLGALDGLRRFEAALLDRPDSNRGQVGVQPWVQVIGSKLKSGTHQGVRGFDLNNRGIAVGLDWGAGANSVAGLAYGHYRGNTSSHNGNKLDSQGHLLGLYGNHQWDRFFVTGDLLFGWIEDEHRRYIAGTRAKGEGDGREFGASLMAGYRLPIQQSLTLEPRIAARYAEVRLDSYSEKGSSAALRVNSRRYQSGELGAGLKLSGSYPLGVGTLIPEATLMGWHDNVGDRTSVTSSFIHGENSFVTHGVVPGRDSYEGTLGMRYQYGTLTLGTGYSYSLRSDANARSGYASASLSF